MSKTVELSVNKVFATVISTLVVGALFGAYAVVRVSDSNTIRITAVELDVSEIKGDIVPRKEFDLFVQQSLSNDNEIKAALRDINNKVN